jgi:dTDP-glucose 4,6-dehydratase
MAVALGKGPETCKGLITYVKDRPGHDRRYAINCDKIKGELGWRQTVSFDQGLDATIAWYLANPAWIEHVRSGAYRQWMDKNYGDR